MIEAIFDQYQQSVGQLVAVFHVSCICNGLDRTLKEHINPCGYLSIAFCRVVCAKQLHFLLFMHTVLSRFEFDAEDNQLEAH